MAKRPYNHADNLNQQGRPKVSEDLWDLTETLRSERLFEWALNNGIRLANGSVEPSTVGEAFELLVKIIKKLDSTVQNPLAWNGTPPGTAREATARLAAAVSMFWCHPAHWDGEPKSASEAINRLAAAIYALQTNTPIS